MTDAELLAEVLAWVNARRKTMSKQRVRFLRKGERRAPWACPVARSLGVTRKRGGVFSTYWRAEEGGGRHRLPPYVQCFIRRFDDGEFPELVSGTHSEREAVAPEVRPGASLG